MSIIKYKQFLDNYYTVYHDLWNAKTQKKWARQSFRAYIQRNSFFDRKFQEIKNFDRNKKVVVAYGNVKFPSSGKGERLVPTKYIRERCKQHFKVVEVDEYNTTKCCYNCGGVMDNVVIRKMYKGVYNDTYVRGLKWCRSTNCFKIRHRDINAALNIMKCGISPERPEHLCRATKQKPCGNPLVEISLQ